MDAGGMQVLEGRAPEATFGFTEVGAPGVADLDLTPVTEHGWRVTDGRVPLRDPFRVLGFVEARGDGYELMQLGAGFEWHVFDSLEAALAFVVTSSPRLAQERMHGARTGFAG